MLSQGHYYRDKDSLSFKTNINHSFEYIHLLLLPYNIKQQDKDSVVDSYTTSADNLQRQNWLVDLRCCIIKAGFGPFLF